jgi:uncharacterized protein YbcV (DUF1398 family)
MDTNILNECGRLSLEGRITFPEVVARLSATGVERYHADLVRREKTYYDASGRAHVEPMAFDTPPIAAAFAADGIVAAIRAIQRNEMEYRAFLSRIMSAGCVGYFVFIAGRRAIYFGRGGELHVEQFPRAT